MLGAHGPFRVHILVLGLRRRCAGHGYSQTAATTASSGSRTIAAQAK